VLCAQEAKLDAERAKLQADQDTLAVQRQATNTIEHHLNKIRGLQEENTALRDDISASRTGALQEQTSLREQLGSLTKKEASLRQELQEQLVQLQQLQAHCELLSRAAPQELAPQELAPKELAPQESLAAPSAEMGDQRNVGTPTNIIAGDPGSVPAAHVTGQGPSATSAAAVPEHWGQVGHVVSALHEYERVVNGALQVRGRVKEDLRVGRFGRRAKGAFESGTVARGIAVTLQTVGPLAVAACA
jgi:hypothetical protein